MTSHKAPSGMVYDWAEPHKGMIIDADGGEIPTIEHLYVKVLNLDDNIPFSEYKLVPETENMKELEVLYNAKRAKEEDI